MTDQKIQKKLQKHSTYTDFKFYETGSSNSLWAFGRKLGH